MLCTKCGAENPVDAEFCCKCGSPLVTDQPKAVNLPAPGVSATAADSVQRSPKSAPTHRWAAAYGWFFVLTGLYLWVAGITTFFGGREFAISAEPFGGARPIGIGASLFQALLFGATGLAIIRRKKIAVVLVWVTVALSGLGVLLRGFIPIEMLLWMAVLGPAIWYTKKEPPLAEKTTPQLGPELLTARPNPWLDANGIGLTVVVIVAIAFLVGTMAKRTDRRATPQLTGEERPKSDGDIFGAGKEATLPPIKPFDTATSNPVQPCPSGIPTDTKVVPINTVDAALGVNGAEAKAWFDPKDHWVDYTVQQWADRGYGETGYDVGQWHLSFKVSNDTKVDRPELKSDGYCLASLAYEIEIESNDGKKWKGTGKFNFDPPLSPGWSQELRALNPKLGSRPKDGNLINWRITKAWGFALNPQDRAKMQNMVAPPPSSKASPPIRLDQEVQSAKLISRPEPTYPPLARQTRIQGTVHLEAMIAKDGTVKNLTVVTGHPLLIQAALDAVKQWRYQPTMSNGVPVEVVTTVDVNFKLNQ
jgi:TonB family protein